MDFSEYTKLLIKTALADWIVVFIIALIILIDEIVYVNSKKRMPKKKRNEYQTNNDIIIIALIIYSIFILISDTCPIINDITHSQYVCISGTYSVENSASRGDNRTEWVVISTVDGKRIALNYPAGIDHDKLPYSSCHGTVWYSENSKFILEFIPDEVDNGS